MGRWLVMTIILSATLLACQRKVSGDLTTVSIQVPRAENHLQKTGGVGAMSTMPNDRKACYGINVTGPGIITQQGSSCSPVTGLLGGFVEPGSNVEVQVPKGTDRKIELYAFLEAPGENVPCPQLVPNLSSSQLIHTYLIGTASAIDTSPDVVTVDITASFPGLSTNLAQQLSLPATCAPVATDTSPHFRVTSGRQVSTGGGLKMIGVVGTTVQRGTASASGIKMLVE